MDWFFCHRSVSEPYTHACNQRSIEHDHYTPGHSPAGQSPRRRSGQVAVNVKREKHEPLGNIGGAAGLVFLADALDGEAHLAVDAGQEGLEARLGHGVRQQALVLSVDLRADVVEDAGRVGDEERVEGRLVTLWMTRWQAGASETSTSCGLMRTAGPYFACSACTQSGWCAVMTKYVDTRVVHRVYHGPGMFDKGLVRPA